MLLGLYILITYFGKDVVNNLILVYISIGGTGGIKQLMTSMFGDAFDNYDKEPLFSFKKSFIEIEATVFDLICCVISFI